MVKQFSLNSVWLLLTRVFTQGLNLLFIAILARKLGVATFGQFTIFASIVFLGNVFSTYGVDVLLIREIAQEGRVTSLASTALWLQMLLSLLWCSVFLIGSFAWLTVELTLTLLVFNISLFPLAFYTVFSSILRAMERMDLFMGLNTFTASLQVVGTIMLVKTSDDFLILCSWLLITQVLAAVFGGRMCKKTIPSFSLKIGPVLSDIASLMRSGWRVALFAPLALTSQRLNLFMLAGFSGEIATGLFSAPARLVDGLKLGHFAITNSLMPSMARPASPQQQAFYKYTLFGLLGLSIALALIVTFAAAVFIRIVYGADFDRSVELLRIVVWALVPYTISVYYSLTLVMRGADSVVLKANLFSLFSAVCIYFVLIPLFGARGAAWGTLVVETVQATILLIASYHLHNADQYDSQFT